jgi:hypothetical protein
MLPVRIQRSRQKKQVSPNGLPIVYVGRPTKWGNPFKVNNLRTHSGCVQLYEDWIENNENLQRDAVLELAGKNLSCFCKIGEPCHADILLKIANGK